MTSQDISTLFTIGHSNHSLDKFVALLNRHQVSAVADVRSNPYSRFCPHFNQARLDDALARIGIAYVFLGKELGARPNDKACYVNGRVSYERLAARPEFHVGLERLRRGMGSYTLALLCAEKDPLDCHRMILVCRHLRSPDLAIRHILAEGSLETNEQAEQRLCARFGLQPTLFESEPAIIELAYDRQAERIAYTLAEENELSAK